MYIPTNSVGGFTFLHTVFRKSGFYSFILSWSKAEHRRIDAFELWCWRRLLRVPWTARRSRQSILKEISPGISLEVMMLKLKLQYFGHLMRRIDSLERLWCWEGLGAGGEGDNRGWAGWIASLTQWTWVWVNSGSWWCHPAISSFVFPFSSCPQSLPASESFQWVNSSHEVTKVLEFQL